MTVYGVSRNVEPTLGCVAPGVSESDPQCGVVLLGGISKHFHWSNEDVARQVHKIVAEAPQQQWQIIDSRRTPNELREHLQLPDYAK